MVELIWHTLVDRRISDDINVVTLLEDSQVPREIWHPLGSEGLRELISGLRSKAVVMRHRNSTTIQSEKDIKAERQLIDLEATFFFCPGINLRAKASS